MKHLVHALAGTLAMILIASFWLSSMVSELALGYSAVAAVKQAIAYGLILLVPCMAVTGASGMALSKSGAKGLIANKKKRMAILGLNGVLFMIPAAIFLNYKAARTEFDWIFYGVQVVELLVGVIQLSLLGLNFREGLRLRRARLMRADKGV